MGGAPAVGGLEAFEARCGWRFEGMVFCIWAVSGGIHELRIRTRDSGGVVARGDGSEGRAMRL